MDSDYSIHDMTTPKIAFSVKQMKTLLASGLDCSDASMAWIQDNDTGKYTLVTRFVLPNPSQFIPAYTLEDVIHKTAGMIDIQVYKSGILWVSKIGKRKKYSLCLDFMTIVFNAFRIFVRKYPDRINAIRW